MIHRINDNIEMKDLPTWLQELWEQNPSLARRAEKHYLELKQQCNMPNVVGQSEQLKVVQKLKDFAYEVCPLHREDDLEEIVGSL